MASVLVTLLGATKLTEKKGQTNLEKSTAKIVSIHSLYSGHSLIKKALIIMWGRLITISRPVELCQRPSCLENSFLPSSLTEIPGRLAFVKARAGKDATYN